MANIETLIQRCRRRCLERGNGRGPGDYWDRSARFLESIQYTPPAHLSQKQRAYLHGLKQDLWEPGITILGPNHRGEDHFVSYIYGVGTGQKDQKNREIYAYTVWQMFPPKTLIERGKYALLAAEELKDVNIGIWHFCIEMDEADVDRILWTRAGITRTHTFCVEERGGWQVRCYIRPRQHIGVLLEGRKRCCENPARARIFRAFRTLGTFER